MPTERSAKPMGFARVDGRAVVADFDGGAITSNAGRLLLGATDRAIGLVERFAACFADGRAAERVVHEVTTLVGQRVFGIALGYEDLIDHDRLRHDPVLGVVLGRLEARHGRCAARWQEHAEPARARCRGSRPLPPDRPRRRSDRGADRGPLPRRARAGAEGDRARSRRHRLPPRPRPIMPLKAIAPPSPQRHQPTQLRSRRTAKGTTVSARSPACARQIDPASRDLHEGPVRKCGLGAAAGGRQAPGLACGAIVGGA
jgi:Transposase DDE domain group 1